MMIESINKALLITGIGMGLVFVSILLLWGLMALLVRLDRRTKTETVADQLSDPISESRRKKQAAVLAVGIALAQQADTMEPHEFPLPPTVLITAWQAVMRTKMHTRRGSTR